MATSLLQVRGLEVSFRTRGSSLAAVRGIDLDVAEGETLAVVGESGSGKSVSMMALLGLLPETATVKGSVSFMGRELLGLSDRSLRQVRGRDVGIVFQDPMSSLNPVKTVGQQIAETVQLHLGANRRAASARAVELMAEVGIPDPRNRSRSYPHQFSGGMRQRVMIAMALACRPRLLIADEPTTALDVTVQSQIVQLVKDLQAEHGMAVVWITHDLGVVAELADRVAVMYAGRVVERNDCDSIYTAPAHPYTVGLLSAVPRMDAPLGHLLPEIPGAPPDPFLVPAGCSFADRCPAVLDLCREQAPPLERPPGGSGSAACWRSEEVLQGRAPSVEVPDEPRRTTSRSQGEALLTLAGLEVHFGARSLLRRAPVVRAVDGVSLTVQAGETLGLVGESGSGKSTLGRAVLGVERPTAGQIQVGEVDLSAGKRALRDSRRKVQMVFQDPASSMNPGFTVGDVVAEPLLVNGIGNRASRARRTAELLRLVELPADTADRHPHEFSGGQRQRIAIARALALEPSMVVCDEAVSSLDVSVQAQVVNLLARLQRELGLALVFIAHDLAVVRHISDRVAVMYMGQVVEVGARAEVYEQPSHPYTRMLLASVPVPDPRAGRAPRVATGDVADPSSPPTGCRFHPRCPLARPGLCDVEVPVLRRRSGTQESACHLAEELPPFVPVVRSGAPAVPATVRKQQPSSTVPEVHHR